MAETAISMEEIKENILKCDRCLQQFDSEDRVPRLLPCQHSFCTNCLDDVWTLGSKLACPSCSQAWDVRGSIIETFPVDFAAMKFVVFIELKAKKGRRLCTDCSEKTTATHHCLDCQVYICEEGLRAHKRFYKQKDHKILSITEIMKLPQNYLSQMETCTHHPGSTLDLFCLKETCMKPVCPSCALISHKERDGHEIRDLKDVVADDKKEITLGLDGLKEKQELIKGEKSQVDRDLMFLLIESKRLESGIEHYFDDFVRQVAEQKQVLRDSLDHAVTGEREHLTACTEAFKMMLQTQDEFMEHCQEIMADPKNGRFLREKEDMKRKLEIFISAQMPSKPERKELFVDLTVLEDSMKKMAKVGEVVYVDKTALDWKCVIEITDVVEEEGLIVARFFITYAGNVIVPSKPPLIKAIIEDSSGMTTHGTMKLVSGDGDMMSTRSDELDSPNASGHHAKVTRQSRVDSTNDSGYAYNGSGNRYEQVDERRESRTGSERSSNRDSSRDQMSLPARDRNRKASYVVTRSAESKVSFEDESDSARGSRDTGRRDGRDGFSRDSDRRDGRDGFSRDSDRRDGRDGFSRDSDRQGNDRRSESRTSDKNDKRSRSGSWNDQDQRSDSRQNGRGDERMNKGRRDDKWEDTGDRSQSRNSDGRDQIQVENDKDVVSELWLKARASGPHKISFRVGGYAVDDDILVFHSKESGERVLERYLHFLTWVGEDKTELRSLNLPFVGLSEKRLNREQCTITNRGTLIKAPSDSGSRPDSGQFTNYCGTTGTRCFSGRGTYYWQVTCGLRVLAKVAAFGKMILEVAVAHGDVLDNSYCVWETPKAWSLVVSICSTHKSICLKAVCNSKVLFDKPLMECEENSSTDLQLGMLLDLDRDRLMFLDTTDGSVLWTFENIDTSNGLWPVFGVYNRYHFRAEVGVTSGENLTLSSQMSSVIEGILKNNEK